MKLKGIATETIFYIVIGIVVVGLLITLVISYTGTARASSDCKLAEQNYCQAWEASGEDTAKTPLEDPKWASFVDPNSKCPKTTTAPSANRCNTIGYNIPKAA